MPELVNLSPRWVAEPGRRGQGLTFFCPCCFGRPDAVRLAVTFANPLDGGEPLPHFRQPGGFKRCAEALWNPRDGTLGQDIVPPGCHWMRVGETFETLTLTPSVDCSEAGHWHGFLAAGEVR